MLRSNHRGLRMTCQDFKFQNLRPGIFLTGSHNHQPDRAVMCCTFTILSWEGLGGPDSTSHLSISVFSVVSRGREVVRT